MSDAPSSVNPDTGIKVGTSIPGGTGSFENGSTASRNGHTNGKNHSSGSTRKKKKASRRRGENEIYMAADTTINAQFKLESMLFQKASYVLKSPSNWAPITHWHLSAAHDQYEDAAECTDRLRRQYRSDSGVGGPPFGYYSLHPSTLMLHPHAVHHYYPATPHLFSNWTFSPPPGSLTSSSMSSIQQQFNHPSDIALHHQYSNQQQHHQHQRVSQKVPSHTLAQHCAVEQQQQQQQPQHETFFQQGQPRQNSVTGARQQSQHQRSYHSHHTSPSEHRDIDRLQQRQQENTAAVLASMRTQPASSTATDAVVAQMKAVPQTNGAVPGERLPTEREAGMKLSSRIALEACRENSKKWQMYHDLFMAAPSHEIQQQHSLCGQTYEEASHSLQPLQSRTSLPSRQQPVLAPDTSEDASLDDIGTGAKQFVKRMITTSEESPLTTGTGQLESLPMLHYTPPDTKKEYPVIEQEITNCDVLLGRGGMTNHHVGNMHFRTLVSSFRLHYCAAKKGDKGRLSKKLTNFVRHKNGRFLQKDDVDNLWYEVGDSRAHGKCAQALREGTADLNRQVANVTAVDEGTVNEFDQNIPCPHHMASYTKVCSVKHPSEAASVSGDCKPNKTSKYYAQEVEMVQSALLSTNTDVVQHQQPVGVLGDQASPVCVTVRPPADAYRKHSRGSGKNPVPKRAGRPQTPKRPLVETQSNDQACKSPQVGPSKCARPAVMTDDEGPAAAERPRSHEFGDARPEVSAGGLYDDVDHDDDSTMEEGGVTAEADVSMKRRKVQHVEDHFDYI